MSLTDSLLRVAFLGAEWVMWLLLGISVISIALIADRLVFFNRMNFNLAKLSDRLQGYLRAGNIDGARELVAASSSSECAVVAAGLDAMDRGPHAVAEAMLSERAIQRLRLEQFLTILGTVGSNAPFVGLFGTVLGIIKASHDLVALDGGAAGAVLAGVFEALVATAVGLFVAIPAVLAFNYFQRRTRNCLGRIDALAHLVLSEIGDTEVSKRQPRSRVA